MYMLASVMRRYHQSHLLRRPMPPSSISEPRETESAVRPRFAKLVALASLGTSRTLQHLTLPHGLESAVRARQEETVV